MLSRAPGWGRGELLIEEGPQDRANYWRLERHPHTRRTPLIPGVHRILPPAPEKSRGGEALGTQDAFLQPADDIGRTTTERAGGENWLFHSSANSF